MEIKRFKNSFAENIFRQKYAQGPSDSWDSLAERLVEDVCGTRWGTDRALMSVDDMRQLVDYIKRMLFIPGGRYLYYAGRPYKAFNNCYLLRAEEDTREEWSAVTYRAMSCLMTGGGIGTDYSRLRASGKALSRTGGKASGPLPLIESTNEVGRNVMQGGSRRSAIYASLLHSHEDIFDFIKAKNWHEQPIGRAVKADGTPYTHWDAKQEDFNHKAPLDMTNISVNYDDDAGDLLHNEVFIENCRQAMSTGEPGFSFNFGEKKNETLRNAPVSGETKVLTTDGYERVIDIVGKEIFVWTGKAWAKTVFKLTAESSATIDVGMTGGRSISCEPSHEFLVERFSGKGKRHVLVSIDRVAAKNLVVGDTLHVSLPKENTTADFNKSDYTFGYMYGDGSFRKSGGGEISLCTEASKKCLDYFDHTAFSSVNLNDSRGYIRCYVKPEFTTHKHYDKPIFDEFRLGRLSAIAGLFDSDGSYDSKHKRVRLASVHREFLVGVQRYLESVGILSHINRGGVSTYGKKLGWLLVIAADYISEFARLIPTKRLVVPPHNAYRKSSIKVVSVTQGKIQDVFCCDVKVKEHSFQAEGVIISNCTEVTSEDDSDVCNLGSVNMGNITSLEEFTSVCSLASKFLVCGTLRADLPYEKVYKIREKNRRLGLGLMGIHEWLLQRKMKYEVTPELHKWLAVYRDESERAAKEHCDRLFISHPVAFRAIAPTGSIGILAATTTAIEPLFAVAYKRRFLTDGTKWKYQFVVDAVADRLIREYDISPNEIETSYKLSRDYEKRIKFQADVQDYVDMSISSTINLPSWGSRGNSEADVSRFSVTLAKYAPRLRGFTAYPDGSRGGQPITEVDYNEALQHKDVVYEEVDICDITGKGGSCGS